MTNFTPVIEKAVALPPRTTHQNKTSYRWSFLSNMKIGDSVFFPVEVVKTPSVSSAVWRHTKLLTERGMKVKFSTRKREENGVLGMRIWRIL
jgi:hypothetical protein